METHLVRLGQLREAGLLSYQGQQRAVRYLGRLLGDAREWGLGEMANLPGDFAVGRFDVPKGRRSGPDEPSRALPRAVVRQLLSAKALSLLEAVAGPWAAAWVQLALGTGRRPGELCALPLEGCLDFNVYTGDDSVEWRHPVLVHDMPKVGLVGYRLPIGNTEASVIEAQRARVREQFPNTPVAQLPLFPAPFRNPDGRRRLAVFQIQAAVKNWCSELGDLRAPDVDEDGRACSDSQTSFPARKIYLYAFRHTWAQDHADSGTVLEVLQDLLGHSKPDTTQVYYRMTARRRHDAVVRLSRVQMSNNGSLVTGGLQVLAAEDRHRTAVGSVTVPFGICVEPSNVKAGGHSCPYRMRCLGCAHFRTDPSYIPELQNYLDELLLARERLLAAGDDVIEPWARHSAMPAPEEVERVRHLIRRCQSEMDALTQDERREIERCVSVLRTGRAQLGEAVPVKLGRKIRSDAPDLFPGTDRRAPGATGFAR